MKLTLGYRTPRNILASLGEIRMSKIC